jgi:hypothetical protein
MSGLTDAGRRRNSACWKWPGSTTRTIHRSWSGRKPIPGEHYEIRHSSFDILRFEGASDELSCVREAGNVRQVLGRGRRRSQEEMPFSGARNALQLAEVQADICGGRDT